MFLPASGHARRLLRAGAGEQLERERERDRQREREREGERERERESLIRKLAAKAAVCSRAPYLP